MTDYAAARFHMVEGQIRPNKVTDHRLVEAMSELPREQFVPESVRGIAYVDDDLPIGKGRFVMEPMVFARMLQEAGVGETETVLDVGCAGGYSTAVLARLGASVVGLDSDPDLVARASAALSATGIANAAVVAGDMTGGHAAKAPYDVIVVEGTVAHIPDALLDQLAEGGRLVAPVLNDNGVGSVRLYQRIGGVVSHRILFEAHPRTLPGFEPKPAFVF
ncbi:protein-L-isoaspartate O-methyltransferase family protein [Azospirillum thermophilum]|uniref:Protein-L-isoaspartate O-methyltransferase n=1 Tax=Azospirillum thermophilum TaxID=2202148 RepID=A0A2S2CRL0_9PROT|nr:protein-L-isoaspartate O-methyltransferase [Azospirillum thermophilum]AWK87010.1 protein-L-isoaspartate O-methyltransferase [Azospirillum thermophilum]